MHQKAFGSQRSPDPLAGFKGCGPEEGIEGERERKGRDTHLLQTDRCHCVLVTITTSHYILSTTNLLSFHILTY